MRSVNEASFGSKSRFGVTVVAQFITTARSYLVSELLVHRLLPQPLSDESAERIIVVGEYESGRAGLLHSSKNQGQL